MQNITSAVEYFVAQCSMHSDVKTSETCFRREQHSACCMQCRIKRASDGSEISDMRTRGLVIGISDHMNLHDPDFNNARCAYQDKQCCPRQRAKVL
jgi:hypothetical protein